MAAPANRWSETVSLLPNPGDRSRLDSRRPHTIPRAGINLPLPKNYGSRRVAAFLFT